VVASGKVHAHELLVSNCTEYSCDDEECVLIYLAIILVIVVIVSVAASAVIPHFWVVGVLLMVTLMAVIAARELLYRET